VRALLRATKKKLSELKVSPENVRKEVNIEEFTRLKESIYRFYEKFGRIAEPIVVNSKNEVVMGSLRLSAIKELVEEGRLDVKEVDVLEEPDLDDPERALLFSFVENVSPCTFTHSDRARATKLLIERLGSVTELAKLLGCDKSTISRWLTLHEHAPELTKAGIKEQVGIRKLEFLKEIVRHKPEYKKEVKAVVKLASEIPRERLEAVKVEASKGFTIDLKKELELKKKAYRAHQIFIREDIFEALGRFSDKTGKTCSEIIEEALLSYTPFRSFCEKEKFPLG
jgi:ParB-like chromosome segregation protein Spo0J